MKILFVGGTGTISTECSKLCIERGYDLHLLNRGQSNRPVPDGAKVIHADIRDIESAKSGLRNHQFDVVVDWITFTKAQAEADYELFKHNTGQFVFISSASAYQKPIPKIPITEDVPLENPYWAYSRAKIDCENFFMNTYRESGFPITIIRPSHTYDKTTIPLAGGFVNLYRMKNGKPIVLHDEGKTLWTLTHSKDFAKGFVGMLGKKEAIGEAYHITTDRTITWNEIAKNIADSFGYELKVVHIPSKFIALYDEEWGAGLLGDKAYDLVFDNSKMKKLVPDFECKITFEEGVKEIAEYYLANFNSQVVDYKRNASIDKVIEAFMMQKIVQ